MIRVSVVGATGYTGEELVTILAGHRDVEITSLSAIMDKPTNISEVFPRLKGQIDLICKSLDVKEVIDSSDLVFLALPHTISMQYAPVFLKNGIKVIDLSADYRLPADLYKEWGMKEFRIHDTAKISRLGGDFKNRFRKIHEICQKNYVLMFFSPAKSHAELPVSLQMVICEYGFNEDVLDWAVAIFDRCRRKIKPFLLPHGAEGAKIRL